MYDYSHERDDILKGRTYTIKTPESGDFSVIVNDVIVYVEGVGVVKRPYELFIHSNVAENHQWIDGLAQLISMVFQTSVPSIHVAETLENVFDPRGGFIKRGGFAKSIVSELGIVLKKHLQFIENDNQCVSSRPDVVVQ